MASKGMKDVKQQVEDAALQAGQVVDRVSEGGQKDTDKSTKEPTDKDANQGSDDAGKNLSYQK